MTWLELSKLNVGTRVRFTEAHDIYPEALVPCGTTGVVKENGLNEIWCAMLVLPDDEKIRAELKEWAGAIYLAGPDPEGENPLWNEPGPLELETSTPA